MRKFLALLHARNMEFLRDRGTLFWNLLFPLFLVFGFAFAFSGGNEELFKVGVIGSGETVIPFLNDPVVTAVAYDSADEAATRLRHHQIDLVVDTDKKSYSVNGESAKGMVAEKLLLADGSASLTREIVSGKPIRYVDWLVPGVIGMNMMFSCIFGVGWIIVRYRKTAYSNASKPPRSRHSSLSPPRWYPVSILFWARRCLCMLAATSPFIL